MDDSSSSDDEPKNIVDNPKAGGKKQKLNDDSSQGSHNNLVSELCNEETNEVELSIKNEGDNLDRTPNEIVPSTSTNEAEPGNEVVEAAPSSSNVCAILLNIKKPRLHLRNYRKRKSTPDSDSDSDNSSRDSDDLSIPEIIRTSTPAQRTGLYSNMTESEFQRFMANISDAESQLSESYGSQSSESERSSNMDTDTDSMDGNLFQLNNDYSRYESDSDQSRSELPSVLLKEKPKHKWFALKEFMHREMGLITPCGRAAKDDVIFERKFCGSLQAVQKMKRIIHLNKHKGCVNAINFHPEGHLLASGSDDMNVVVWDWARSKPLQVIRTGHKSNVFQSKFLYLNANSQLNIVTCARDGQVRLIQCPPSGGSAVKRRLMSHSRAAHKLFVSAAEPHLVLSAGEDGLVMQCDVRTQTTDKLFLVKQRSVTIPLYSIHGHPLESNLLVVAGRDRFVRLFDRRKPDGPASFYCPSAFNDTMVSDNNGRKKIRLTMMHLTCAVFNHNGSEILASYNDDDIYLFDTIADKDADLSVQGFQHKYSGHRNSATFKSVSFLGPKSEFIISGSDCSHIYIWDKKTEAIVQWMPGDQGGVVNCIECHPRHAVIATSGLDHDVKIWSPFKDPEMKTKGLAMTIKENTAAQVGSPLFDNFLPNLLDAWRQDSPTPSTRNRDYIEFDGNACTTF